MPKLTKPLAPSEVKNAKSAAKPYKLADGGGMFLHVLPNGSKRWRIKYRRPGSGKENMLSLGTFPEVSLKRARQKRDEARALLADGIDPGEVRKAAKAERTQQAEADANTFEKIAREWMARQEVADATEAKNTWLFERWLFPEIGQLPINSITPRMMLDTLRKIEATGKLETAKRAKTKAGQVFRYAVLEELADADPTASLRGALKSPTVKHHAAITDPAKVGELMRAIDGFSGNFVTAYALKLAPLVFVRPGELRRAEWSEIDFDAAMWRIPGERMKMGAPHLVPLSEQAVAVLRELYPLTGNGRYLFPSVRTPVRPMSENTVNAALRRLGYTTDDMTGHGFRSMAATRLNEMGWNADAIERQLAHAENNKVRDAYTSAAQYLDERTRMMQAWGDYLDALKAGGDVVAFKRKAARRI